VIANCNRTKDTRAMGPLDFMVRWEAEEEQEEDSEEDIANRVMSIFNGMIQRSSGTRG
jgi:hypothetical protein